MRWFLRSAVAAAGFGSVAGVVLSQEAPQPVAPPVRWLPVAEPPPSGITRSLIVPSAATVPAGAGFVAPISPAKPAPAEIVQVANLVPAPEPPRVVVESDAPADRPDRLPVLPEAPPAPAVDANDLPAPPAPGELPPVPLAPGEPADLPSPEAPAGVAVPGDTCPTTRVCEIGCDPLWHAFPQDGCVRVRGWLGAGYVYNSSNPNSKFNGPYNSIDRSAEPMFNQAYLIVERPLPGDGSFGAGFRIDALFGYDFFLGQSRGFEVDRSFNQRWNGQYYGLAIPQAYLEAGTERVSLKLGHFYTLVGYEVLPAVGNFFYSHAYSYQFGQPFTHWGGLLTAKLSRNWEAQAGLVNGWDALVGRANNINVLAGLKYTAESRVWWTSFALVSGQEQNNPANLPFVLGTDGNRTRYSFLIGLTPGGSCARWEYVFHHYYGFQENGTPQRNLARWYGIDQYLYYRASEKLRLGGRFEWFRDEDGTRVGLNRPSNPNKPPLPGNYFSLTGGLNYAPMANLMIRPELRWDFTSDTFRRAFNDGQKNNQLLLGCDVVWQF
jgi:hypothetical protein